MTAVDTSPDLRHARVYVSVLGDAGAARADARRPRLLARLPADADRRRAAPQAHAHAGVRLRRVGRPGHADQRAARGRRPDVTLAATELEPVVAELRQADKLLLTTHEGPDGDALGSLLAMHWILQQLGKDSVMYMSPDEFPLPYEYRDMQLRRAARRAAGGHRRAGGGVPRLRQHRPHAGRLPQVRRHPHREHRPPPRQHPLRDREPGGAQRLLHRRDRLRHRAGAGGGDHARDRRRALRRPRHRHRPLHVREHHAGGPPDGRRADPGRRRAAPGLPPPVRGPARSGACSCSSARWPASSATTTAR